MDAANLVRKIEEESTEKAKERARRGWVLLDAHVPHGGMLRDGVSLIDFNLNLEKVQPELIDPQRPERLLRLAFRGLSRRKRC